MERGELLLRLDSLSNDARAAGYLLLITELSAVSTLAPQPLEGQRIEQQLCVEAAAASEARKAEQAAKTREEELAKQQVIEGEKQTKLSCHPLMIPKEGDLELVKHR